MSALYSLHEVAADMHLDETLKDPARWLTKQIKQGRIRARKIGRSYMMTRADIEAAIESLGTTYRPTVEPTARGGLSVASSRRRVA